MRRPKRGEYYDYDKCAPRKSGRKCYGDCLDCYLHDVYHFKEHLKKNKLSENYDPDRTDTPRAPHKVMVRGRSYGG